MCEALGTKGAPQDFSDTKGFQHKGLKLSGNVTDLVTVSHHVIYAREGTHSVCGCQRDIHSKSEAHPALPGKGLYSLVCIHDQCCDPQDNLS